MSLPDPPPRGPRGGHSPHLHEPRGRHAAPFFGADVLRERSRGVLLHLSSLPAPHGIRELGQGARAFADFDMRRDEGGAFDPSLATMRLAMASVLARTYGRVPAEMETK